MIWDAQFLHVRFYINLVVNFLLRGYIYNTKKGSMRMIVLKNEKAFVWKKIFLQC